jgi:hypothetical protein
MANPLSRMLGLLSTGRATEQAPPPLPQPARLIKGARQGLELCMLPTDITEADVDLLHTHPRPRVVQLKADGIRSLYIDGRIVSREGTPLDCALHCQPGLRRLEEAVGCPIFIDGEYVEEGGFNPTLKAMRAGRGQGVFWIFDAVPLEYWQAGEWRRSTVDRLHWIRDHVLEADSPFVGLLNFWLLDAAGTRAKARELWLEGYEGVVTKDPEAGYVRSRSDAWRRLKQTLTFDCPIVDIAVKDGKLCRVIVRGPGDVGPITLGRGWSGEEADVIIRSFASPTPQFTLGKAGSMKGFPLPPAEITYQLTCGEKRSVRGARFIRLRSDKKETGR